MIQKFIKLFQKNYPNAHCALNHSTPEELLLATVLSAQCTDERVNLVTPKLFQRYPNLSKLARAKVKDVEDIIKSTGFYKNKAKNLVALANELDKKNAGKVYKTIEELTTLPGVGRKTANVVLGNAFGIASGVVVDTHVKRLSGRMGFTQQKTPEKIELDLIQLVPKEHWVQFSHWLIWHGRLICKARKPECDRCFLDSICPKKK